MNEHRTTNSTQPMIVKYVQHAHAGIQPTTLSRHAIGYVIRGRKYLYNGDVRRELGRGDMFFLASGHHYMENVPEGGKPFEQIIFYYSPEDLGRILANLNVSYGLHVSDDHDCPNCHEQNEVIFPAWAAARNFFNSTNSYLRDGIFNEDHTAEHLKMTELIYLIFSQDDCCLKAKLLENTDSQRENFDQIIHNNIFTGASIEELAQLCNRSLTSFKKEFRKHFFEPPHKWFIRQRLMHSRLLLISSDKLISEIGNKCGFPNTSHFIKLFKKEYGMTPAAYRTRYSEGAFAEVVQQEHGGRSGGRPEVYSGGEPGCFGPSEPPCSLPPTGCCGYSGFLVDVLNNSECRKALRPE